MKTRHRAADQSCLGARGSLQHDRRAARASCCGPKLTIRVSEGACAVASTAKSDNLPGPGPLDLGAGQVSATGRRGSHGPRRHAAAQWCCATDGGSGLVGLQSICRRLGPSSIVWHLRDPGLLQGQGLSSVQRVEAVAIAGPRGHPQAGARGPGTGETARGRWADLQIHCGGVRDSQHVSESQKT